MEKYYFDYASTTPADPQVIRAMEPYFFERFGNPSSPHTIGQEAKKALEDARQTVADFLNAQPQEILFTSGGTESNNHATIGQGRARKSQGQHIIVSAIEHHSALRPVESLQKEGFQVSFLPVDRYGWLDPEQVICAVHDKTILIILLHASNEIGTLQDIEAIGRFATERKMAFHVDAVQTVGHLPVDVQKIGCSTLSLSGHKLYGPKGIGALYLRKGTPLTSFLLGGDQEQGRRASTQNVAGAVGLAKAVEICQSQMLEEAKLQRELRDRLIQKISTQIPDAILNGHPTRRLPNNAHFSFPGIDSESLLMSLDLAGICASMGSACTSGVLKASHVLTAIGLSEELAFGSLRLSVGRWTRPDHIDYLSSILPDTIRRLRKTASI